MIPNAPRLRRPILVAALAATSACGPQRELAQPFDRAHTQLVGTWMLEAAETLDSTGRTITTSTDVRGMLIYTAEGRVAVQNMLLPRPKVAMVPQGPDSVHAWSDPEVRAVISSYDAYYGTFEVDDVRAVVTHHVEGELRPNLVGAAYRRRFAFRQEKLLLSAEDPRERWQYVWAKVK